MLKQKQILDETDKRLRLSNEPMTFPISKTERNMMYDMVDYLKKSQDEEYALAHDIRPGMGLAGPQVGINKRFFVVVHEEEEGVFKDYILINPKIISHSEEKICASAGEGCLSVNREVDGYVPRFARVTITGYDPDGNPVRYRGREELAIAFQHEYDHLDGILFFDRIDPEDPFKNEDDMRVI